MHERHVARPPRHRPAQEIQEAQIGLGRAAAEFLRRHDLSVRKLRIGRIFSRLPTRADALPMRPVRFRWAKVSTVK